MKRALELAVLKKGKLNNSVNKGSSEKKNGHKEEHRKAKLEA
jgi:hypothetical protein